MIVLITLLIIGALFFLSTQKKDSQAPKKAKGFVQEAGVDTSSYKNILDSTKEVIADAEATRANIP